MKVNCLILGGITVLMTKSLSSLSYRFEKILFC